VTSSSGKYYTILPTRCGLIGLLLAASLCYGCQTGTKDGLPAPVAHADRIGLYVPEQAVVNWDDKPGLDGVRAQVMLFRHGPGGKLKSVLVTGEVDLILYEGPQPVSLDRAGTPFRSWTFNAEELARLAIGQYGLAGYSMRLAWGRDVPRADKIWMVARYRPPMGQAIYSSSAQCDMPLEPKRPLPPAKRPKPPVKRPKPIE